MTVQAAMATALLRPGAPCPDGLRVWNGSNPSARFDVHRNNVLVSLIDALAETFPVCAELVGPAFFRAMAMTFVTTCPPRSRVLASYGEDFPAFVEGFEPASSVPYLADVARLEFARVRAYHAPDAAPLAPAAMADVLTAPALLEGSRVDCHPSVSVVRSPSAVLSLWAAHRGAGAIEQVETGEPEDALVARVKHDVQLFRLPLGGAAFVSSLLAGRTLGEAIAMAHGEAPEFDLPETVTLLIRGDAITRFKPPSRT